MSQHKKVLISLPISLLDEVDDFVGTCSVTRSGFIRDAMKAHVAHCRKMERRERLIKGYEIMSAINKEWADSCNAADNETQFYYEELLSESESM